LPFPPAGPNAFVLGCDGTALTLSNSWSHPSPCAHAQRPILPDGIPLSLSGARLECTKLPIEALVLLDGWRAEATSAPRAHRRSFFRAGTVGRATAEGGAAPHDQRPNGSVVVDPPWVGPTDADLTPSLYALLRLTVSAGGCW
jgi:hypothetical protein